ncbi:MAG: disulfide bond formation protein DsbA [Massilia sp.]|jgi:thiol:disulfide interchange protein DsbA|nr:disulfide bond formation protein DsbA [Massilia sp.]
MQIIRNLLCAAAIGLAAVSSASGAEPKSGVEYITLPEVQNTDAGNKVEVTEFFAYYCPHCNRFEPLLAEWVRKQGANIVFKRVHVSNGPGVMAQQRLFYTLEALGLLDQYHAKVFHAMHVERQRLATDEAVLDWAVKSGIDRAKFVDAWNSFGTQAKLRRADAMMAAYRVNEWPLVAIDGRFITSPSQAGGASTAAQTETEQQQAALQVMDYLVAKAKAEKK